jgi:hypothetical protein
LSGTPTVQNASTTFTITATDSTTTAGNQSYTINISAGAPQIKLMGAISM